MSLTIKKCGIYSTLLGFIGAAALGGCGPASSEGEGDINNDDASNAEVVGSSEQAVYSGWTPWISEENPPITCDGGSLIRRVQCSGSYCDNKRVYCEPTGASAGESYWTPYFSEEPQSYQTCASGYWVTGLACRGRYCDNTALQCSLMYNISADGAGCYWTGWVSEEGGGNLSFGAGYYMRGAQCSGRYCDNMRFYVCRT